MPLLMCRVETFCCVLAAVRPIICADCKIYALSIKLDKRGVFHMYWIWLDAEKDVDFISGAFVGNLLITCGIFYMAEVSDGSEGEKCNLEPVTGFAKDHAAYGT